MRFSNPLRVCLPVCPFVIRAEWRVKRAEEGIRRVRPAARDGPVARADRSPPSWGLGEREGRTRTQFGDFFPLFSPSDCGLHHSPRVHHARSHYPPRYIRRGKTGERGLGKLGKGRTWKTRPRPSWREREGRGRGRFGRVCWTAASRVRTFRARGGMFLRVACVVYYPLPPSPLLNHAGLCSSPRLRDLPRQECRAHPDFPLLSGLLFLSTSPRYLSHNINMFQSARLKNCKN